MIEPPITTVTFREQNGRFPTHPLLSRLGILTAWVVIFLLWGSWLLAAWVYVQAILTNLETAYHWDPFIANGIHAAAAGLGISPALFAWVFLASASVLVATFGTAGVILFRHKQDGFGAFLGVSLVLIGTYIASPVATVLSVPWPVLQRPLGLLGGLAFVAFGALLYLFPDGRFIPRWTRWLPPLMFVQMVVWYEAKLRNNPVFALIYLTVGLAVQIYRYRRLSGAVARRHVRWIMISFAAFMLVVMLQVLVAPNLSTRMPPLSSRDLLAAILSIPAITAASVGFVVALSVAILRDGLYNLDIFINRALVYGGLTGLMTAVYTLLIGGIGLLAGQGGTVAGLVVATGLVAAGIRPLQHQLQTLADKLVPRPATAPSNAWPHPPKTNPSHLDATHPLVRHPILWRAVWGTVACLVGLFYLAALPARYQVLQTTSETSNLVSHTLSPTDLPTLAQLGLSIQGYAGTILFIELLFALGFAAVSFFIAWRKIDDPFALLTAVVLLTFAATTPPTTDALGNQSPFWHSVGELLQAIGTGGLAVLFFLFPNGRFVPPWTRWVTAGWLLLIFIWFLLPQFPLNMLNGETWQRTPVASTLFAIVFYNLCAFSQIYRYRYIANQIEKQQTKWIVVGFSAGALAGYIYFLPALFWPFLGETGIQPLVVNLVRIPVTAVFILCLPVTIAVALLRYHLWDVDIIINRTLVYGGMTVTIVTIYSLIVGGLGTLLQSRGNFVIALLTTGLIAVFFQPLLNRLQRGINRLMFGERDDPYTVLSKLGAQLQTTATPETMLQSVVETVATALKLPYVAIQLADEQTRLDGAAIGKAVAELAEIPLRYQNETVGYLVVSPRSPNEPFTEQEQRLLTSIAAQAGAMAYSMRLTAALQRSREKLVLAREEERRRIRRNLHDELGPTLASQTFVLDTILDSLENNPQTAANLLQSLKTQNQKTVADVRRLVYELRPPALDELGVVGALQAHVGQINGRSSLHIHITAQPSPLPPLPAAVEVAVYRIALEAINNVVRHAQARHCDVCLRVIKNGRSQLQIEIADNGVGLPTDLHMGVGFTSMRERAEELGGSLNVTRLAKGTQLMAQLPLEKSS